MINKQGFLYRFYDDKLAWVGVFIKTKCKDHLL